MENYFIGNLLIDALYLVKKSEENFKSKKWKDASITQKNGKKIHISDIRFESFNYDDLFQIAHDIGVVQLMDMQSKSVLN